MHWLDRITGYEIAKRSGPTRLGVGLAINALGAGLGLLYAISPLTL